MPRKVIFKSIRKNIKDQEGFNPADFGKELSTDYEDKCGNCHKYLGKQDKYCKYCGTKRGEGEFKPYENVMYCVYGPPIKHKYKCKACGNLWIVSVLGGDNSKYCPECGQKKADLIESKMISWMDPTASDEPFDSDKRPNMFSKEEVEGILAQRDQYKGDPDLLTPNELLAAMKTAGVDVPKKMDKDYPRTERDIEQIGLARSILSLRGTNTCSYPGITCPICGGNVIAGFSYDIKDSDSNTIQKRFHMPSDDKALVFHTGYNVWIDEIDTDEPPAYLCLTCGNRFGTLEVPELNE